MDQEKIGKFIAKLRKEKEMTQEELGNIVGVTGKAVSRWERGNGVPDISIVNDVSEALGVTTTELLNGERVTSLKNKNLDEITENSIDFYKTKLMHKFKKVLIILLAIIFFLFSLLLLIFYLNNYNKCQLYRIDSDSSEISLSGILSITNKRNTLVISNFKYKGIYEKMITSTSYEILLNGESIYKVGEVYKSDSTLINSTLNDYIKTVNFYLSDLSSDILNKFVNNFVSINICVLNSDGSVNSINIPLKITKEFSNSKFLYFK